jgi:hypothetical protein
MIEIGTQVITLVDIKGSDGRTVRPRGSIGMVVEAVSGYSNMYKVDFPDGGESLLRRQEIEVRRSHAEVDQDTRSPWLNQYDLFHYSIYRCTLSLKTYNIDEEETDAQDYGIYLPPAEAQWSLYGVPDLLEDRDEKVNYWELQSFLVQALKAVPEALECLFTTDVEKATPLAQTLRDMRQSFLSKLLYKSIENIAVAEYRLLQRKVGARGTLHWRQGMYLIRLLLMGARSLRENTLVLDLSDEEDRLLAVRYGEMTWTEYDEWRKELLSGLECAQQETALPEKPDYHAANEFLIQARLSRVPRQSEEEESFEDED